MMKTKNLFKLTSLNFVLHSSACLLATADEHTIKAEKFQQVIELSAIALPETSAEVVVKPTTWSAFKIEKLLSQGTVVKKGDQLIWIDTEAIDKAIEATEKARVVQKLRLQQAQQELEELEKSTPITLAEAQLKVDRYKADYDHYIKELKSVGIDKANSSVKEQKDNLSYVQEELKQLLKMYEADGLTEETEEIVLQRAKNNLEIAKRELAQTERDAKFTIEVATPRNDIDWENGYKKEQQALESLKIHAPRNLEIKKEEVAKLIKDDERNELYLADLKSDRLLMDFKSPADGIVYYGQFKEGYWLTAKAMKVLFVGGDIPSRLTLMSIVAEDAKLTFNAFLTEANKSIFSESQPAILKLKSNPWQGYSVSSSKLPAYPNLSHQWLAKFSATDEMAEGVLTGTQASISIIASEGESVLTVPVKAVKSHADGTFSVKMKTADGEPMEVKVSVGRYSAGELEILNGVEADQVIITP